MYGLSPFLQTPVVVWDGTEEAVGCEGRIVAVLASIGNTPLFWRTVPLTCTQVFRNTRVPRLLFEHACIQ